jgi:hypothetical protein
MLYPSAKIWIAEKSKKVALFGMSGLGKTRLAGLLREGGSWFHYSADYRIGTRYMGEHIVDNFKREAMRNPFLRDLLLGDSIYIASNISFQNLAPLSTYLGKPGDPARGGIAFDEYLRRQRQHREAEIAAMHDIAHFTAKAREIYGYDHFVADTSGSLCEVVDPSDAADPVMAALSAQALPVWIRGSEADVAALVARFDRAPKPIYYDEEFLREAWDRYGAERKVRPDKVDPDDFIRWGFRELIAHRLPLYRAMAERWGVTIEAREAAALTGPAGFEALIASRLPGGA